jgi:hypothetical protein
MKFRLLLLTPFLLVVFGAVAAPKDPVPTWTDPDLASEEHPDFDLQGEYTAGEGASRVGLQAAALDQGRFHVLEYAGGLPGAGWDGSDVIIAILEREALEAKVEEMKKIKRKSPTMGKEAPGGALVIFDGSPTSYIKGKIEEGLLWAGAETTTPVRDFFLHVEFRLPYKPARNLSSQDRGNSGLYVFNNYEIQILDSFGLDFKKENNAVEAESENNQWCGSFYKFKTPDVPMSFPPLQWQTYDIEYTAPKFEEGEKVANARFTIRHNGRVIHDDVELPKGTGGGGKRPEKEEGFIFFQDHGNPVAFRNIWLEKR